MFKNHFKTAFRNFIKNKTFGFLNIIGLSMAFGVAILLCMAAFFDLSYDKFHENGENLYQVYSIEQSVKGPDFSRSKPIPFAPALKSGMPGIAKITRHLEYRALLAYQDKEFDVDIAYVDNDFFSMFSFPIIKGKTADPLEHKTSVVLTRKAAKKIFGTTEAVGKTVTLLLNGKPQPLEVSAILEDFPEESSLGFEVAVNFENSPNFNQNLNNWDNSNHEVYVLLRDGISAEEFENKSHVFTALHFKDDIEEAKQTGARPNEEGYYKSLHLLPFETVHFADFGNGTMEISKTYPYLLLGIALLILFIANVNFINMGIAKNVQRIREIGMRKTLGATKRQLFAQFWVESALVFLVSIGLGILISALLLNKFKALFHTQADFGNVATPIILLGFLLVFFAMTFVAGGYPTLMLNKIPLVRALTGKFQTAGKNHLRDGLMVVQFAIAIFLISGSLVLGSQWDYLRNKDLGFEKEQVIAFPLNGKTPNFVQRLRNELRNNPNVLEITAASDILGKGKDGYTGTWVWEFDYKNRTVKTNLLSVDYDYVETLDLELVAGRSFDRNFGSDSLSVLVNEAMAKALNEEKTLGITLEDGKPYTIVGVLKNYNFQRLRRKIEPITIFLAEDANQLTYAYVKVAPQNLPQSFEQVKNAWEKIEPNVPFMGSFLDENIARTLQREKTLTTIVASGSLIAILLSCIGLFAVSLMAVSQRTKEIGVRKVVGASVFEITFLLVKDFLKLVGIAFLITVPIAWWALENWLQNYAYRIDLNVWIFMAAGLLAVLIAFATMSAKTLKAAWQNPVKSLRVE